MIIETTLGYIFVGLLFLTVFSAMFFGCCYIKEATRRMRAEEKARHYRRRLDDCEAELYKRDFIKDLQNAEVNEDVKAAEVCKVSNK